MRADGGPPGGDLTVAGFPEQFRIAEEFLRERQRLCFEDPDCLWGLGWPEPDWRVPGNHDHWRGRALRAGPWSSLTVQAGFAPEIYADPARFLSWPAPFAWREQPFRVEVDGLAIEVYPIDSQTGLGTTNFLARGCISASEFERLDRMVAAAGAPTRPTVRVLLVHHPLAASRRWRARLDQNSLDELMVRLHRHGFGLVLAGHGHRFGVRFPIAWHEGVGRETFEVRAPSTLQGEEQDGKQGFLLHEVRVDGAVVRWRTHPWLWDAEFQGFTFAEDGVVTQEVRTLPRA